MIAWLNYVLILLIVIVTSLACGIGFLIQSIVCSRVKKQRNRMIPMIVTGVILLICALLWLFGIPTTVFVTGPGKLAVYDHILLAIVLAPTFVGMEAAWIIHKRERVETEKPLYAKGVWYSIMAAVLAVGGAAMIGSFSEMPQQMWTALILGVILLINTLYRSLKFKQAPALKGMLTDITIFVGALVVEAMIIAILPDTIYQAFNTQIALGTSASVCLIVAVVFQFVLNQDDRPGVFAMLRLLVQVLIGITGATMVLWIIWYQINCDDNKSFIMALAFFGPVLAGLFAGYLLLLRRNGSLEFTDRKAQGTVHGFLPVALLALCFLTGAVQFANMEYRHEVRSELSDWYIFEKYEALGVEHDELCIDLQARDQASGYVELLREERDNRVEFTLCGYWTPFRQPWEFKIGGIRIPMDGKITQVCINESYYLGSDTVLRFNSVTDEWEEVK